MFQNFPNDSICQEKDISTSELLSPNTLDMEPFSDFESNFHLSFNIGEPILEQSIELTSNVQIIKEDETNQNNSNNDKRRKQKIWAQEEDARLKFLFEHYEGKWSEIVKHMPQRNASQCQQRWRRVNPPKESRHIWTQEQDELLKQLVVKFGRQWMKIAKCLGNITGKQARDRYINKLDQSINKQPWTQEEDLLILNYYVNNGPKWTKVSNMLQGRPENHVKNRFYSYIKRNYLGEQNRYQIIYS